MATVNVRRSVANSKSQVQRRHAGATEGAEIRRGIHLSPADQFSLGLYRSGDDNDANTFMIFETQPVAGLARVALENDLPPTSVVVRIIGLQHRRDSFFLPCMPINWDAHQPGCYPSFHDWSHASYRYPRSNPIDPKTILPGSGDVSTSRLDRIENYISLFHGTLMNASTSEAMRNAWLVLRTLRRAIEELDVVRDGPVNIERLGQLIENRDSSIENGKLFKNFIDHLHPAQYYGAMYRLMTLNQN